MCTQQSESREGSFPLQKQKLLSYVLNPLLHCFVTLASSHWLQILLLCGSVKVSWFAVKSIGFVYLFLQWSSACQQLVRRNALSFTHPFWLWNYMGLKSAYLSSEHILAEFPSWKNKWVEIQIGGMHCSALSIPMLRTISTEEYNSSGQSWVALNQIMWNNQNFSIFF